MTQFGQYMMSNYIIYNLAMIIVVIGMAVYVARKMPKGWISGASGIFITLIAAVAFAAMAVFIIAIPFMTQMPPLGLGAIAWAVETGVEFTLIPILVTPLSYLVARFRRRATVTTSA